jgi:hypothetical protein
MHAVRNIASHIPGFSLNTDSGFYTQIKIFRKTFFVTFALLKILDNLYSVYSLCSKTSIFTHISIDV